MKLRTSVLLSFAAVLGVGCSVNDVPSDTLDAQDGVSARIIETDDLACRAGTASCADQIGLAEPATAGIWDPIIHDCKDRNTSSTCEECRMGGTSQCCPAPGSIYHCKVINCVPDKEGKCPSYP